MVIKWDWKKLWIMVMVIKIMSIRSIIHLWLKSNRFWNCIFFRQHFLIMETSIFKTLKKNTVFLFSSIILIIFKWMRCFLVGPALAGKIYEIYDEYDLAFYLGGLACIICGAVLFVFILVPEIFNHCQSRQSRQPIIRF